MPKTPPDFKPVFLGLDGLAGLIAAFLLWLLPMNQYSYMAASLILLALIWGFVWLLPIPMTGRKRWWIKIASCVAATILLGAVLIPEGISRFSDKGVENGTEAHPFDSAKDCPSDSAAIFVAGDSSYNGGPGVEIPSGEHVCFIRSRIHNNKGGGFVVRDPNASNH